MDSETSPPVSSQESTLKNIWIHAYTDGSAKTPLKLEAGAYIYVITFSCQMEELRRNGTHRCPLHDYKAKLEAINEALKLMEEVTADQSGAKVVILSDSKPVLQK
ncbi:hypothetical protein ElyMa_002922800 [Elysia marginata]|uniref:RNase H type-1 domain-containing protein n=1 Tax=Elysia marginata TaxID=1093978 RepID=A0AAV4I3I8_9GAST|nr:hypothetical protein ElyMa_002922800 [Elysia marginata]